MRPCSSSVVTRAARFGSRCCGRMRFSKVIRDPTDVRDLSCWYDISDVNNGWRGNIVVGDKYMDRMYDLSGNEYDQGMDTAAWQPTLSTAIGGQITINGLQAVWFDGVNDRHVSTGFGGAISNVLTASGYTCFTVFVADSADADDEQIYGDQSGYWGVRMMVGPTVRIFNQDSVDTKTIDLSCAISATHVLVEWRDAATLYARLDGGSVSKIACGAIDDLTNNLRMGIAPGAAGYFHGEYGEQLIYNCTLSSREIAGLERYLASKWGVALGA